MKDVTKGGNVWFHHLVFDFSLTQHVIVDFVFGIVGNKWLPRVLTEAFPYGQSLRFIGLHAGKLPFTSIPLSSSIISF